MTKRGTSYSRCATIDGAICGDDQFTDRVLNAAPRLKVISKWGTGIDSIDTSAAAKPDRRTPNAYGRGRTPRRIYPVRAPIAIDGPGCPSRLMGQAGRHPLREWHLEWGIRLGNIGKAVVRRARAFGMTVLGTDPVPVPASFATRPAFTMMGLHALLERADLCCCTAISIRRPFI